MRNCEERRTWAPTFSCLLHVLVLLLSASGRAQADPHAQARTRRDVAGGGDSGGKGPVACHTGEVASDIMACAGVQRSLLQNHVKWSQKFDITGAAHGEETQLAEEHAPDEGATELGVFQDTASQPESETEQRLLKLVAHTPSAAVNSNEAAQPSPENATRSEQALDMALMAVSGAQLAQVSRWVEPLVHRVAGSAGTPDSVRVFLRLVCLILFFALCMAVFQRIQAKKVQNSGDKVRPIELTPSVRKLVYETCGSAMTPRAHPFNNMMLPPQPRVPYSTRLHEHLCPALVVPHGHECLLAVRHVMGRTDEHITFDILDMHDKPVLSADIVGPSSCDLKLTSADSRMPLVTLRTPSADGSVSTSPADATGSLGAVLSVSQMASPADLQHHQEVCRLSTAPVKDDEHEQQSVGVLPCSDAALGMCIHNASGELFGVLTQDPTHPRYVFVGRGAIRSHMRLFFGKDFGSFPTVVTNEHGEHLADTEPTAMPSDPQGKFYRVRVNPATDACLVLSGLIGIDVMESQRAWQSGVGHTGCL